MVKYDTHMLLEHVPNSIKFPLHEHPEQCRPQLDWYGSPSSDHIPLFVSSIR